MFRNHKTLPGCFLLLLLLGIAILAVPRPSGLLAAEVPSTQALDAESSEIAHSIESVKERRQAVKQRIDELVKQYGESVETEQFKTLLTLRDRFSAIYDQQLEELQQLQTLEVKRRQYAAEIATLRQKPKPERHYSFMDLDQSRDELAIETRRNQTLASKIGIAEEEVKRTTASVRQLQDQLAALEGKTTAAAPDAKMPGLELEMVRLQLELAQQTLILRQFELRAELMTQSVHRQYLALLQDRVEFLQRHAEFEARELEQQLQLLKKEIFELNRLVSRAKEQQTLVQSRLMQVRKKLLTAAAEERRSIEEESDTLQLQLEALKNQIDSTTRRIESLTDSKEVWQRRYAVFIDAVEQSQLQEWKKTAKQHLQNIDHEEDTLRLWLTDWQARLAALNGKIEKAGEDAVTDLVLRQRDYMGQIIATLQGLQNEFAASRRLHEKLIDEIEFKVSLRSWRDWIAAMMDYSVYGNTLLMWSYAVLSALITFLLLYFMRWILIRKLKYFEESGKVSLASGFLDGIKRANSIFFLMLGIFVASQFLTLDSVSKNAIYSLTLAAFVFQAAVWGSGLVRTWVFLILARRTKRDGSSMGALTIFNFASQVILWSFALLLILQNLGIDITALVAGLGIGGIAVALALQRILNDLFSSLSIVLDKPFVIGDFVVFDDFFGNIEHIGIKTTRIRSLSGEQIICANGDLLDTRIRNFKRMNERRVVFKIGVVYQTPEDKLCKIPEMLKEIIESQENARFDRAHFCSYGDFALLFEIVYYVLSSDYNLYMDIQQAINLEIFKRFQADHIEFAYPSQSIYLQTAAQVEPAR